MHTARGRHYGMDWLRIGAFGLLILYHVGMAFVAWPYEIKVAAPQDWVSAPMLGLNSWRLALLFFVSGYASGALNARSDSPGAFGRTRLKRLGLPLLAGFFLLNTPQPWVAVVTQHGYPHGFGHFVLHDYYRFQQIGGVSMPTWMHLWFVLYLIVYTLVLAGLGAALRGRGAAIVRGVERSLAGALLLPLPILWIFAMRELLPPGWVETHGLFDDWSAHAVYLPIFLLGVALRRSERLMAAIGAQWKIAGPIALAAYAGIVAIDARFPGATPIPPDWLRLFDLLRSINGWCAIVALVGIADRFLTFDHRWRPVLAEAVFPFYLIHQTIILVVGYWLLPTPTSALARFVILVATTAAGCWIFYIAGRRIGWLRPWIGLGPAKAPAAG